MVPERTHGTTCKCRKLKLLGKSGGIPPGKILKSGYLRVHFQHSGAKIRVFEQNTDSISNFGFFGSYSKEKKAASSCEVAGKFRRPPVLLRTLMKMCS